MAGENISTIMVQSIKVTFPMDENKDLELLLFLMVQKQKLIGSKHMFKDKEKYNTPMVIFSKVSITCHKNMVKGCIFGLIIQNMRVNLRKTPYKERPEFTLLPISIIMEELEMENEMDREIMFTKMETLLLVNGEMI